MVFVDTSAWFAFFLPTDAEHPRITQWHRSAKTVLITSDYCIDETLTVLLKRGEYHRALQAGRTFFHLDLTEIHFLAPDQIRRAWILFRQRAAAGWSFTDCTSKIVIDDLEISQAVALDDHFRQFGNVTVLP